MKSIWVILFAVFATLLALGPLAAGCGGGDDDDDDDSDDWGDDDEDLQDYLDAIPDPDSIRLTVPESSAKDVGELAWLYEETVDFSRRVTENVLLILSLIDEITSYPPSDHQGDSYIWGPWTPDGLSPAEYRFTIERQTEQHFTFLLDGREEGVDGDWTDLWWGEVEASESTQRRGVGDFEMDFDALHSIDPTYDDAGSVLVDYDTITDGRRIDVTYDEFVSEDYPGAEPVSGTYNYHNHADNSGEFLFDALIDLNYEEYHGEQYALREDFYINTRWLGDGRGRSEAVVIGGDLAQYGEDFWSTPIEEVLFSECWDADFLRTYFTSDVVLEGGEEHRVEDQGDSESCVFEQEFPETS